MAYSLAAQLNKGDALNFGEMSSWKLVMSAVCVRHWADGCVGSAESRAVVSL